MGKLTKAELEKQIEGYKDIVKLYEAWIAVLLEQQGGEAVVSVADVKDAQGRYIIQAFPQEETASWKVRAKRLK